METAPTTSAIAECAVTSMVATAPATVAATTTPAFAPKSMQISIADNIVPRSMQTLITDIIAPTVAALAAAPTKAAFPTTEDTIVTSATVAAATIAKRTTAKRFSVAEQAAMTKVLLTCPGGALGSGPSGADLSALASDLGDTVERVTSWVYRARSRARAEHQMAVHAEERVMLEERKQQELGVKRKAEAAAEAIMVEKRGQLTFFRETDDTEALRAKVLELMPLVDTVAHLENIIKANEAAKATLEANVMAAIAEEAAAAAADEQRAKAAAMGQVTIASCGLRHKLKDQLVYHPRMDQHARVKLAAEEKEFSPQAWSAMHARVLATQPQTPSPAPGGANTCSVSCATVGQHPHQPRHSNAPVTCLLRSAVK
jgi:hypothetical protein